jgi:type VI secretion system protein VasD
LHHNKHRLRERKAMLRRAPPTFALLAHLLWVSVLAALGGCASAGKTIEAAGHVTAQALRLVGLSPKEPAPAAPHASTVALRIQASPSLNVNAAGQSLSVVMRLYKLRGAQSFLTAPYEVFASPGRERDLLGEELIEVREIQMLPGQLREWRETMPAEATHLGVVTLFLAPDSQRWRVAFATADAARTGVSMGLHACSMSVAVGRDMAPASPPALHAAATCPPH